MSEDKEEKWPEGESPPSAQELRQARGLGAQVDALLRGEVPREQGEELSAAVMVRAAARDLELDPSRRDQLINDALDVGAHGRAALDSARGSGGGRLLRWAPALAVAASLLIGLSVMLQLAPRRAPRQPVPIQLTSRASDALIGRPIVDRAGASRRLDLVFADRLGGYRKVMLGSRETL